MFFTFSCENSEVLFLPARTERRQISFELQHVIVKYPHLFGPEAILVLIYINE